jgi:hypothetical protein
MASDLTQLIHRLNDLSVRSFQQPTMELDFERTPARDKLWMPPELLSLYGTPTYDTLNEAQILKLSQLEMSLFCSIFCYGEKEVVANFARLMLKRSFRDVRVYLYHFLREEMNHIFMFSELCSRYGAFYPTLYSYVQGDLWNDPELDDLMAIVHVLIFEEIGHGINMYVARSEHDIPALVRDINQLHVEDESRHVSFGRHWLKAKAPELLAARPPEIVSKVKQHLTSYLDGLHHDFFNAKIYAAIGLADAFALRSELVARNDMRFFGRRPELVRRLAALVRFLQGCGLIDTTPALAA